MIPGGLAAGTRDVHAAYDGSLIAQVETGGAAAVETALATAFAKYRDRDSWLTSAQRIAILERTAGIIQSRAEELAVGAAREGGKPLIDSRVEIARGIDGVRNSIEVMRTEGGKEIPMGINAASLGRVAFTRKEPIGVVVAVSAFNHPFNLIIHQVMPAVATGCPIIVKPAAATPLSCMRIVGILREAGLPEAWCQPIVTASSDDATRLATDPRVSFFAFIGSPGVGWMLRSKLAPGTRCALEHGGAAPVIVAEDANLDEALPLLLKGGFYHAGQVCVSVQRIFAHSSIARELANRLADGARKLRIGDSTSPETEVGPLISTKEVDRVAEWVTEAVDGGAECLSGGSKLSDTCYECTVLFNPPQQARVSQNEIFGPVVCVYSYDDLDDAIGLANSLPFAFQSAVFTQNIDTALRVYRRIRASAVMVNDHSAFRVDWAPFAGLDVSGHGVGGIPYTMEEMQIEKMIVIKSKEL